MRKNRVAVVECSVEAHEAEVVDKVGEALDLVGGLPKVIRDKKKILLKPNLVGLMFKSLENVKVHRGHLATCTDTAVVEGVLAFIREHNPSATIIVGDGMDTLPPYSAEDAFGYAGYREKLAPYDVHVIDLNEGPFVQIPLTVGALAYREYTVNREIADVDCTISVGQIKCHQLAGISLSCKNLFGLIPRRFYGTTNRNYLHTNYPRLARVWSDLNTIYRPDFVVIDGIVAANYGMGGTSKPVETGIIVAGDNAVSTDSAVARFMGFDPDAVFPSLPFRSMENYLAITARQGLGSTAADEIQVVGDEVSPPLFTFEIDHAHGEDSEAEKLQQTPRVEARRYLENRGRFVDDYHGDYIYLVGGEVAFSATQLADALAGRENAIKVGNFGLLQPVLREERDLETYSYAREGV